MDVETSWYYLQTRYYDPVVRRFINADNYELIPHLAQNIGELNLYSYCNNNPVMYTDETGQFSWNDFIKAIQKAGAWMANGIQNGIDWVSGTLSDVSYSIGDFFTQTVPDFFEYTVWDNWIVDKAWNTFIVGTIYQQGLVPAWNWTSTHYHHILFWVGVASTIAGITITIIGSGGATIPLWVQLLPSIIGIGLTIWQAIELYS